ncbi:MAG: TIGR01244 family sulfur transferase [Litorivicinus sp.]
MIIRTLTPTFSVADQVTESDIDSLLSSGFKSVICNRPDEEGEPHLGQDAVKNALEAAGIEFRYLPVNGAAITDLDVAEQAALVNELPAPLLAYCRTGTRCTKLWALDPARTDSADERIAAAAAAGINIEDLRERIR